MKIILSLIIFAFVGCGGGSAGTGLGDSTTVQGRATIDGIVYDESIRPVSNAEIIVLETEQRISSDSRGRFSVLLAPGRTTLVVNSSQGSTVFEVSEFNKGQLRVIISGNNPEIKFCKKDDNRCSAEESCVFPIGTCGESNSLGLCKTVPDICTQELSPTCGCDGMTYSNECQALSKKVSLRYFGECN